MLIDWSQNDEHKTTVGVYSLRARERPTVSTPLAWDEVEGDRGRARVRGGDVLERVEEHGDLFAPVAELRAGAARRSKPSYAFGAEWSTGRLPGRSRAWRRAGARGGTSVRRRRAVRRDGAARGRLHGLALSTPTPAAELVSRADWAAVNLDSLSQILDPVAARLDERLEFAGPLAGRAEAGAAATLAAEAGLVIGYLSLAGARPVRRVAAGRRRGPAPAVRRAEPGRRVRDLDVDADSFHRWICAHELTHVFQFQGVPWLREHIGGAAAPLPRDGRGADRAAARPAGCRRCPIPPSSWRRSATVGSPRSCRSRNSGH